MTHCAQSAKIILTIRNNPCKNMGDFLEKGDDKMKILCVEDGSVDIDAIEGKGLQNYGGLKNGKMLIYRQGATPPFVLDIGDANKDEEVAIYKRALELYSQKFRYDCNKCPREVYEKCNGVCEMNKIIDFYIQQAKKELEEQKHD